MRRHDLTKTKDNDKYKDQDNDKDKYNKRNLSESYSRDFCPSSHLIRMIRRLDLAKKNDNDKDKDKDKDNDKDKYI